MDSKNLIILVAFGLLACFALNTKAECKCETADELLPHADCTLYYQCSNFELIESACPPGLYFNPGLGSCDFPDNVTDCVGGVRPDPCGGGATNLPVTGTTGKPEEPTTEEEWRTTTRKPEDPTTEEEPMTTTRRTTTTEAQMTTGNQEWTTDSSLCPPEGIVSIAYPGNCSLYYLCVNGDPTLMSCSEGLYFNEEIGKCDLAENVDCKVPTEPPTTTQRPTVGPTTEASPVDCPSEGIVFLPDPKDCKKYYLCANGEAVPQECADGLLFDPVQGKCAAASEVECNIKPECPEDGIVYLPLPNTCTEYLMCISGEGIEMKCADGTEFDPTENKCVLEENYECPYGRQKSHFLFW